MKDQNFKTIKIQTELERIVKLRLWKHYKKIKILIQVNFFNFKVKIFKKWLNQQKNIFLKLLGKMITIKSIET